MSTRCPRHRDRIEAPDRRQGLEGEAILLETPSPRSPTPSTFYTRSDRADPIESHGSTTSLAFFTRALAACSAPAESGEPGPARDETGGGTVHSGRPGVVPSNCE